MIGVSGEARDRAGGRGDGGDDGLMWWQNELRKRAEWAAQHGDHIGIGIPRRRSAPVSQPSLGNLEANLGSLDGYSRSGENIGWPSVTFDFITRTVRPDADPAIKLNPESITLRWTEYDDYDRCQHGLSAADCVRPVGTRKPLRRGWELAHERPGLRRWVGHLRDQLDRVRGIARLRSRVGGDAK